MDAHPLPSSTIGLEYSCYIPPISLTEYYLSLDQGQTWGNWVSAWLLEDDNGNSFGIQNGGEDFLPDGTGWRLFTLGSGELNQLLHTSNGSRTWTTIHEVTWPAADFDFVDAQIGWAIVYGQDAIALVHTNDGGKTWSLIKPLVTER
jgi:hypothetical protein